MRFRDREERERYMDSLERQMVHQREQIQRTLDYTKGSGRLRTVLEMIRNTLPTFPRHTSTRNTSTRNTGERAAATERSESEAYRSWWKVWR